MRNDLFVSGVNVEDTTQFREISKSRNIFVDNFAFFGFRSVICRILSIVFIWYPHMISICDPNVTIMISSSCVCIHQMPLSCLIGQRQLTVLYMCSLISQCAYRRLCEILIIQSTVQQNEFLSIQKYHNASIKRNPRISAHPRNNAHPRHRIIEKVPPNLCLE